VFAGDAESSAKAKEILLAAGFLRVVDGGSLEEAEQLKADVIASSSVLQSYM